MQMCESGSISNTKINIPFCSCYLFFKDFLNLQDQQNGKQTLFE